MKVPEKPAVSPARQKLYFAISEQDRQILLTGTGDEKNEAWDRVFQDNEAPALRSVLRRAWWLRDEAFDLVQDAFIKLHANYDPRKPLGSYLATILLNCIRDDWRKRQRHIILSLDDEETGGDRIADPAAEARLRGVTRAVDVRRALERLEPSDRELLVLRFFEGRDVTEIARLRGISVPNASTHIKQALQRLRAELERSR